MSILKVDTVSGIGTEGTVLDGDVTFDSLNYMTLPKGTTTQSNAVSSGISSATGAIRYNTDSNKMECFDGQKWWEVSVSNPDLNGGVRGVFMGGGEPARAEIDYITISTAGNAQDFGDLTEAKYMSAAMSSRTRGLAAGGRPSSVNIDYITIATTANAVDWGADVISDQTTGAGGCGNQTRGLDCGGGSGGTNHIYYIQLQTTGTYTDFGDLATAVYYQGAASSSTRGFNFGGDPATNVIQYITIATLGNAEDFGDLTTPFFRNGAFANSTRAIAHGGQDPSSDGLTMTEYITMPTTGNSADFGDLTVGGQHASGTASPTRGIFFSRQQDGSPYAAVNVIDYCEIATQGNFVDFGDPVDGKGQGAFAVSNGHGGL